MWNGDRILVGDNEKKRGERGYRHSGLEPTQPASACGNEVFGELACLLLPEDFARGVGKSGERLDVDSAFGAIEIMLFVFIPLDQGEFAEHILYCRLQLYCFVMVHLCHPKGSAGER